MAPNSERIQTLLEKCKHPDTDVKSDAIAKLQLEFEAASEIPDADTIIATFKPFLRSANPHLSLSVLFALPPLIRLLHTEHSVRHALLAFMAPGGGGLLERMGDNKERTREGAREVVEELCARCLAFGIGGMKGKGVGSRGEPESVGALFERFLKEGGFGSKVARTREQCLILLVSVRKAHSNFPLRPYLSPLIDALQDSDGAVRACAQQSIVLLFGPGSGVSDTARTELKKEAGKKQVRKQIWDPLWERVCGVEPVTQEYMVPIPDVDEGLASSQTSETGVRSLKRSHSHGALAASAAASTSRPASRVGDLPSDADVTAVHVASARDLENEFNAMLPAFQGKESEQNWMQREAAIMRVRGMLKGDVWRRLPDAFLAGLGRGFMEASLKALASLRTTLASVTCSLYATLAATLRQHFDPFVDTVFLPLLRMSSLTKKIAAQQSQATLTTVIENTSAHSRLILPNLFESMAEKNVQTRQYAAMHLRTWLLVHGRSPVEHYTGGLDGLEKTVRRGLADPNPVAREEGRKLFWAFESLWPDRARAIMDGLDANARRGLERANTKVASPMPVHVHAAAAAPVPSAAVPIPPVPATISAGTKTAPATPATAPKRPSVREMIQMHREQLKKADTAKLGVAPGSTPSLPRAVTSPASVQHSSLNRAPAASTPSVPPEPSSVSLASPPSSPRRARSPPMTATTPTRPTHIPVPVHNRSPSVPDTPTPTKPRSVSVHSRASSEQATSGGRVRSPVQRSPLNHATSTPAAGRTPRTGTSRLASPPVFPDDGPEDLTVASLQMSDDNDETLLLAQNMPLPSEGEEDETFHPFQMSPKQTSKTPPPTTRSKTAPSKIPISPSRKSHNTRSSLSSTASSSLFSPPPTANTPRSHEPVPQSVIEDALRAQAEQAESAANMLLELVEPEDRTPYVRAPTASLASSISTVRDAPGKENAGLPRTPMPNRQASAIRQAAESFRNSPAQPQPTPGMLRALSDKRHETGLWRRKIAPLNGSRFRMDAEEQADKLDLATTSLAAGTATAATLQDVARICASNPCNSFSPTSSQLSPNGSQSMSLPDIWNGGKAFDGLFDALMKFLVPERNGDVLEFGLVLLWEMLENQRPLLDGRQMEMFTALLNVRWCNLPNVLQATNAIRDGITTKFDPVFGVTQLNACLRTFVQQPIPPSATEAVRSATYAFGLVGLGKFIMRLPAEILEDELPRLKALLLGALTDKSSEVREAASLAVVAAQLVLQDEIHLFMLLDGLDNGKKNLLIYYFEKYKIRSADDAVTQTHRRQGSGQELIEKEMNRLDMRATPPRPSHLRTHPNAST